MYFLYGTKYVELRTVSDLYIRDSVGDVASYGRLELGTIWRWTSTTVENYDTSRARSVMNLRVVLPRTWVKPSGVLRFEFFFWGGRLIFK